MVVQRPRSLAVAAAALATTLLATALVRGQSAGQAAVSIHEYVAIGCLTRQAARLATGAAPQRARYVVTDRRSDPPTIYVLNGDRNALQPHVGHVVEVSGPIVGRAAGPDSGRALILKVTSLVYIASACPPAKRP